MEIIKGQFCYFLYKTYVVGTHKNRLSEAILMSIHNICFYRELTKIILQLSSNTLLMCSIALVNHADYKEKRNLLSTIKRHLKIAVIILSLNFFIIELCKQIGKLCRH